MIEQARRLAIQANLSDRIEFRVLQNESISALASDGPFDGGFSSFSGLNCVQDFPGVASALARLLPARARFVAGMTGRLVPWEIVWFLAHGKPGKALRRLRRDSPYFNSGPVQVRNYSVKEIAVVFAADFRLTRWEGFGIAVPPSYLEPWARRFSGTTRLLAALDWRIGRLPLFRCFADGVLLEFERR
jgi:hypothetical protein